MDRFLVDVYCIVYLVLNKIKYEFFVFFVFIIVVKFFENEKDFVDIDVLGEIELKKKGNLCVKNIIY